MKRSKIIKEVLLNIDKIINANPTIIKVSVFKKHYSDLLKYASQKGNFADTEIKLIDKKIYYKNILIMEYTE